MSICHTSSSYPPQLHFSGQELLELVVVSLLIEDAFLKGISVNDLTDSNTFFFSLKINVIERRCMEGLQKYTQMQENNVYDMEDRETRTGPSGSPTVGKAGIVQTAFWRLEC